MKDFKALFTYVGLTGQYQVERIIKAKNEGSARKKASSQIGNRDCIELRIMLINSNLQKN